MTVNSKLESFAQNELILARSDKEREDIKGSAEHLQNIIKNKLGNEIKHCLLFGSFTRNTILPRKYDSKSDVDIMVVFNTSEKRYSPGTYRTWIRDVMEQSYPNSIVKKDFPVVKLELQKIMFDIVPAYSGRLLIEEKFFIPGRQDEWMPTAPNDINDGLSSLNKQIGGNVLRNAIRLCKYWNANAGYPRESYPMEKLIIEKNRYFRGDTRKCFLHSMQQICNELKNWKLADRCQWYQSYGHLSTPNGDELKWLRDLLPGLE